jgi:leucyl-tRNA synthetase
LEWDDRGIEGAFKFLNRVWRILETQKIPASRQAGKLKTQNSKKPNLKLDKKLHRTIKDVSEDIDKFKFNTAIASIMELVNEVYQNLNTDIQDAVKTVVLLLCPFVPHFSEELWQGLGHKGSIFKADWPKYDPSLLIEETITMVIQVNGKVRAKIDVPADISEDKLKELVLANEKLKSWMQNKPIKNFILVPKKLVNIVI